MWFTLARSNRYSPSPARVAPGVLAASCDIVSSSVVNIILRASGGRPRRCLASRRAQQRLCPPPQDGCLVAGWYGQAADLEHAVRHAHVEGIVAAEQDAIDTRIADQKFQHVLRVHDGIEVEPSKRLRRRLGQLVLRLLAYMPAVQEAPGLVGHEAAAMGEADLECRVALEHAAEHQARGGDGGIERIADQIVEVI